MSISSLKSFSSFGAQTTSIIISYLTDMDVPVSEETWEATSKLQAAISSIWENFLNEPSRYIDTLLYDRVIDFRGSCRTTPVIRLFFEQAYPLLIEIAATPLEKEILADVMRQLKINGLFLSIFPKEGKKSSSTYFANQGIRFPNNRVKINKIDSYGIDMQYGYEAIHLLSDQNQQWHLGTISKRSSLLHELCHLDNMLHGDYFTYPELFEDSSWVWTNEEECRVTNIQNEALEARGEMRRLSHKSSPFNEQEYVNMSAAHKLEFALSFGADGTVKEICDRHLAASLDSKDRIILSLPRHVPAFATAYLKDRPQDKKIIDKVIDIEFQEVTRNHKNIALIYILLMLEQSENGIAFSETLLECIDTKATVLNRLDVISFIQSI